MHWFVELIIQSFGGKTTKNGWISKNCTCCTYLGESADRRSRLGLKYDLETVGLNCFNCRFHSKWTIGSQMSKSMKLYLSSVGYSDDDIKTISFRLYKESYTLEDLPEINVSQKVSPWNSINLPEESKSIEDWACINCTDENYINVINYIANRKLLPYSDKIYWTPTNEYNTRFIIPFYYDKKIVGYTARTATNESPKYKDNRPDNFIFNLDNQLDNRKYVIYCEGILDALHMNGICTFGNRITDYQLSLLEKLNKDIIFIPDLDTSGFVLLDKIIELGWKVSIPQWKYKDVSESVEHTGRIITLRNILDNIETNEFNIRIKSKLALQNRGLDI